MRELYTLFILSLFLFYNGRFNSIRHKRAFQNLNLSICHAMKVINNTFPLKTNLVLFPPDPVLVCGYSLLYAYEGVMFC